ncbi:hypothetical protein SSX86_013255 [Deinandra increscens subsp. villosa]|uniref:DCD domain-containing protein n=1 Tax=Deinandra increscens subsp. villosa TaxID=3103831 RepID=A0AAP0D652_9ASTR
MIDAYFFPTIFLFADFSLNCRRMVNANKKDETSKSESSSGKDAIEKDKAPLDSLNVMEEEGGDEDEYDEEEYDEEEEEDMEEDDEEEPEEEPEEEKVNDAENAVAVANNESTETKKENALKEDEGKAEEPKSDKKSDETVKSNEKRPPRSRNKNRKKNEENDSVTLAVNGDKPESSNRKKSSKRVESMGMVFMCSSKTKADCFRYKILGLPETKKEKVLQIYRGMRLFLFDVDLRLMYGIFKAAGPGGYNIEPKAFKSEFPSQVRFTVLDDCLPLAEEKFKSVLKENYYSRNKFEGLLKAEQVKNLCKLFMETVRGGARSKSAVKTRRTRPIETHRARPGESRRNRLDDRRDDRHISRSEEKRKRRARDEERRPRSPPSREKRRYIDYERPPIDYERPPVTYDREPPVSRYLLPQAAPIGSPVRLYTYDRPPLDAPPYIRERMPEPHSYRVVDRDRERDPYLAYSREQPLYRDPVYPAPPPEYHLVTREYHHPTAEYRIPGGSRVPSYRDVEIPSDYRSSAGALPEYRSRTHYNY